MREDGAPLDKPLRLLAGRPLLAHAITRIGPQVAAMVINANGDPARFADFGLEVIADDLPNHPGPLAGILAGMRWAAAMGFADVLSVPTDTPFLPTDLVTRLVSARHAARLPLACAASGGWTQRPARRCRGLFLQQLGQRRAGRGCAGGCGCGEESGAGDLLREMGRRPWRAEWMRQVWTAIQARSV